MPLKVLRDGDYAVAPVVNAPASSAIYVEAGTKALTVPAGATLMVVEALAGTAWLRKAADGSLPATWPPAADDADAEAWLQLKNGAPNQIRELAVTPGEQYRLEIPSGAQAVVYWY